MCTKEKKFYRDMIEDRFKAIISVGDYYKFLGYIDLAESLGVITYQEWQYLVGAVVGMRGWLVEIL